MSELTSPVIVKDVSNKLVLNFVGEANMAGKPAGQVPSLTFQALRAPYRD
jgi:hypothetical protein